MSVINTSSLSESHKNDRKVSTDKLSSPGNMEVLKTCTVFHVFTGFKVVDGFYSLLPKRWWVTPEQLLGKFCPKFCSKISSNRVSASKLIYIKY